MDFVAVPPGTAAPAALVLRGPDPDLELAPGDDFITAIGAALGARITGGGARRSTLYSSVSGILSGFFHTDNPALLASFLHLQGPSPLRAEESTVYRVDR